MPIHAAGIYRGDSPICVSDFFVSSYTPSLGALIDARNRPIPRKPRVLAAAQPTPWGVKNKLPNVKNELEEIAKIVPPQDLIYLASSDQLDFEGKLTSVKNVLEKLPEASILHLACHGTQDTHNPLKSGFILANGERLTIQELIKHRFPNAHMAILSACHTASNDVEQPEEAMNLASTLMFLGFGSILGTKWYVFSLLVMPALLTDIFKGPWLTSMVLSLQRLYTVPCSASALVHTGLIHQFMSILYWGCPWNLSPLL